MRESRGLDTFFFSEDKHTKFSLVFRSCAAKRKPRPTRANSPVSNVEISQSASAEVSAGGAKPIFR